MSLCPHRDLSIAEHCPEQAEHAAALMERPGPSQPVPFVAPPEAEPAPPPRYGRIVVAVCGLLVLFSIGLFFCQPDPLGSLSGWSYVAEHLATGRLPR